MRLVLSLALLVLASGCSSTDMTPAAPQATGVGYAFSDQSPATVAASLTAALAAAGPVSVVAQVDHGANAASVGLTLPPTVEVFFGNPALGTPLMQRNQTAGLDLPQHVLIYQSDEGGTVAVYNTTDYLAARHGLAGAETLAPIAGALDMFTAGASGGTVAQTSSAGTEAGEGIVTVVSAFSVEETLARLRSAVEAAGPLSVAFELDHAANAARVGLELRPTRLLVFGNPRLGTPLMQARRTVGLDLPQRVLVWQDAAGTVRLSYTDPAYLAARHGIAGQDETIRTITEALAGLARGATTA